MSNFEVWWDITCTIIWFLSMGIAAYVLVILVIRGRRKYKKYKQVTKDWYWCLLLTFWAIVEGSIENIVLDSPPGPRVLSTLAIALFGLRAVLTDPYHDPNKQTHGNAGVF